MLCASTPVLFGVRKKDRWVWTEKNCGVEFQCRDESVERDLFCCALIVLISIQRIWSLSLPPQSEARPPYHSLFRAGQAAVCECVGVNVYA